MKVDHLEWPAEGDDQLFAIDQTEFYGNYCLMLFNPKVATEVEAHRRAHGARANGNALVDAVTTPAASSSDRNEDIVDRIIGHK
jgi:hypothetical protein